MYQDFDDELFLSPESTVSLHFDAGSEDAGEDWGIDHGEWLAPAKSDAWARHAVRSNGFGDGLSAFDAGNTPAFSGQRSTSELPRNDLLLVKKCDKKLA